MIKNKMLELLLQQQSFILAPPYKFVCFINILCKEVAIGEIGWYNINMKILVITDTHNRIGAPLTLLRQMGDVTHAIHLGDLVEDAQEIQTAFPHIPVYMVRGNNDFAPCVPNDLKLPCGRHIIFATHGHLFGVKQGLWRLAAHGKSIGATVVLFGHTHAFCDKTIDGVRLLNPSARGYLLIDENEIKVGSDCFWY